MFAESGASSDVAFAWDDLPVLFSVQRALHRWELQKSRRIIPSRAKYRVHARARLNAALLLRGLELRWI